MVPPLPFKIVALGPFQPQQASAWTQSPVPVDRTTLDDVLNSLKPSVEISLAKDLCPKGTLDIAVRRFKGFRPDGLVEDNGFLADLLAARMFLKEAAVKGLASGEIESRLAQWPRLPPISLATKPERTKKETPSRAVDDILKMVAMPDQQSAGVGQGGLSGADQTERLLRQVLTQIFANRDFREMEAVWQGVRLLLDQGSTNAEVAVELVPTAVQGLDEALDALIPHLVQSPPSLLLVDFPFDSSARGIETLQRVAELAETILAPAVCWIDHRFFHLDGWHRLGSLPYLPHHLEDPSYAKWRRLTLSPGGRWLTVTCNRVLARPPYGPDNPPRSVFFDEADSLFISPVWALGALIAQSVSQTGWPAAFTQWRRIRLENLPVDAREGKGATAAEVVLSEDRIGQFEKAGLAALVSPKNSDIAFVLSDTTVSGVPLSFQALVSGISHFVLWCKDHFDKKIQPEALKEGLTKAFVRLWESKGTKAPEDLRIVVGTRDDQGRLPVTISLTPPREVAPSSEPVEMEFWW